MIDFLVSLFWFSLVWRSCQVDSRCHVPYLNRKFHLKIKNPRLERLLLDWPWRKNSKEWIRRETEQAQHLVGIDGILEYLLLIPSTVFVWAANGRVFLNATPYFWYDLLFITVLIFCTTDFWLGYFLLWWRWKKEEREKKNQEPES